MVSGAFAQLKDEVIRFSEGLPSDFVKELVLNDEGYLILATRRGLSQYDGYRFLAHSSASVNITSLAIKDDVMYYHDVYVGLCKTRSFYELPKVIAPNMYHDADPNNDHFDNIFIDSGGRVWCSDFNNIKYFFTNGGRKKTFLIREKVDHENSFVSFLEPEKGKVFVFTEKGLFTWNAETDKLSEHPGFKLNEVLSSAKLFNRDEVLLGTQSGDVMKYRISTGRLEKLFSLPDKKAVKGFENMTFSTKQYLMPYSSENMYSMDDGGRLVHIYHTNSQLINKVVGDAKTNVIWLATNKGLIKLFNPYAFVHHVMIPVEYRKSGHMISDIVEQNDGSIYCINKSNLIWVYHPMNGWRKFAIPDKAVQAGSLYLAGNTLLICTNKGLYTIKDNRIEKLALGREMNNAAIKKCIVDLKNNLWILPPGKRVKVFSWPDLKPANDVDVNDAGFWQDNVWNDIFCNTDGKVWIAGWTPKGFGIAIHDSSKRIFTDVSKLKANANQSLFAGDYYNRISKAKGSDVLISAYGGWNLLNANGGIKQLLNTKKYEVANDRVEGIAEDNNGKIWFATEEGLNVYSRNADKVIRISQIDGLSSDDLIYGFRKLRNGNLAIGIENGFSVIDINMMLRSQLVNKLELCAIKINGRIINSNNRDIKLLKDETELELLFSSLTYMDKRKVVYRYKFLEDNKWNYLGNKSELSLRHLAPGTYHIVIQAGDNLDNWQPKALRVKVYLPAPFYKTQWFLLLVFLSVVAVIIYIYRQLLRQHKIEEQYKRKLKEAEMQALRSQMNPHFMFNTLNSINSFIIEHKTDEASEYLTTFSRLMRDILDNSKHTGIPLKKELQTLKLYLNLEAARLENSFDYRITVSKIVAEEGFRVPPLILQPFAENAIWHGLRNKEGKGLLEVIIDMDNEHVLHIIIRDNGIGRKAAASFMMSQFKHKSHGVDITSSRLKLLSSESSIIMEDLYNGIGKPAGTAVHIYLTVEQ